MSKSVFTFYHSPFLLGVIVKKLSHHFFGTLYLVVLSFYINFLVNAFNNNLKIAGAVDSHIHPPSSIMSRSDMQIKRTLPGKHSAALLAHSIRINPLVSLVDSIYVIL